MDRSRQLQLRGLSWSACGVVAVRISLFVASGVGQDSLQVVRHADEYGRLLLRNPGALRATLACDNHFIALYSGAFVLLLSELLRLGWSFTQDAPGAPDRAAVGSGARA